MRIAVLALVLASGCGGQSFDWEARAVVGVEPQRVEAASLGPVAATAQWLLIRAETANIAYPLAVDGSDVVVSSAFVGGTVPVTYDPYDTPLATKPASIVVPLHGPLADPGHDVEPGVTAFRAHIELSVIGEAVFSPLNIDLAPEFDPCAGAWTSYDDELPPVPPNSHGSAVDQDSNRVLVGGFVVRIFIQFACSVSVG